ncbi:MAG: hypothetical protein ACK5QX_03705 [bacterium]
MGYVSEAFYFNVNMALPCCTPDKSSGSDGKRALGWGAAEEAAHMSSPDWLISEVRQKGMRGDARVVALFRCPSGARGSAEHSGVRLAGARAIEIINVHLGIDRWVYWSCSSRARMGANQSGPEKIIPAVRRGQ